MAYETHRRKQAVLYDVDDVDGDGDTTEPAIAAFDGAYDAPRLNDNTHTTIPRVTLNPPTSDANPSHADAEGSVSASLFSRIGSRFSVSRSSTSTSFSSDALDEVERHALSNKLIRKGAGGHAIALALVDELYGTRSWRRRLLNVLASRKYVLFFTVLVALDVVVALLTLVLDAQFPTCDIVTAYAVCEAPVGSTTPVAASCVDSMAAPHTAQLAFTAISVSFLAIFFVDALTQTAAYGRSLLRMNRAFIFGHCLDLLLVVSALTLEVIVLVERVRLTSSGGAILASLPAFLIIARLGRYAQLIRRATRMASMRRRTAAHRQLSILRGSRTSQAGKSNLEQMHQEHLEMRARGEILSTGERNKTIVEQMCAEMLADVSMMADTSEWHAMRLLAQSANIDDLADYVEALLKQRLEVLLVAPMGWYEVDEHMADVLYRTIKIKESLAKWPVALSALLKSPADVDDAGKFPEALRRHTSTSSAAGPGEPLHQASSTAASGALHASPSVTASQSPIHSRTSHSASQSLVGTLDAAAIKLHESTQHVLATSATKVHDSARRALDAAVTKMHDSGLGSASTPQSRAKLTAKRIHRLLRRKSLDVSVDELGLGGFGPLALLVLGSKRLERLRLHCTKGSLWISSGTNAFIEAVAASTTLEVLDLSGTNLPLACVAKLVRALTRYHGGRASVSLSIVDGMHENSLAALGLDSLRTSISATLTESAPKVATKLRQLAARVRAMRPTRASKSKAAATTTQSSTPSAPGAPVAPSEPSEPAPTPVCRLRTLLLSDNSFETSLDPDSETKLGLLIAQLIRGCPSLQEVDLSGVHLEPHEGGPILQVIAETQREANAQLLAVVAATANGHSNASSPAPAPDAVSTEAISAQVVASATSQQQQQQQPESSMWESVLASLGMGKTGFVDDAGANADAPAEATAVSVVVDPPNGAAPEEPSGAASGQPNGTVEAAGEMESATRLPNVERPPLTIAIFDVETIAGSVPPQCVIGIDGARLLTLAELTQVKDAAFAAVAAAPSKFLGDGKQDLVVGTLTEATRGLAHYMQVSDEHLRAGFSVGTRAIIKEIDALRDAETSKLLHYILHEPCSEAEYPNGTRDKGRHGERLADFCAHHNAVESGLEECHVVALRLYTTSAYRFINEPLRRPKGPHPLAHTTAFIADGIKRLRTVGASSASSTETMTYWRGMRNVGCGEAFMHKRAGGTEVAPMSTTTSISVATEYGASKETLLFKLQVSNPIMSGAKLGWLSAFPAEAEVLFPPLTYLQPTGLQQRVVIGGVTITVIEVTPNLA